MKFSRGKNRYTWYTAEPKTDTHVRRNSHHFHLAAQKEPDESSPFIHPWRCAVFSINLASATIINMKDFHPEANWQQFWKKPTNGYEIFTRKRDVIYKRYIRAFFWSNYIYLKLHTYCSRRLEHTTSPTLSETLLCCRPFFAKCTFFFVQYYYKRRRRKKQIIPVS